MRIDTDQNIYKRRRLNSRNIGSENKWRSMTRISIAHADCAFTRLKKSWQDPRSWFLNISLFHVFSWYSVTFAVCGTTVISVTLCVRGSWDCSADTGKVLALNQILAAWGCLLRQAEQRRRKALRQRMKERDERRRQKLLAQRRSQAEERQRREALRRRMQQDDTMNHLPWIGTDFDKMGWQCLSLAAGLGTNGRHPAWRGFVWHDFPPNCLVVWNMNFICPYIGKNHPNWLSYFSEG